MVCRLDKASLATATEQCWPIYMLKSSNLLTYHLSLSPLPWGHMMIFVPLLELPPSGFIVYWFLSARCILWVDCKYYEATTTKGSGSPNSVIIALFKGEHVSNLVRRHIEHAAAACVSCCQIAARVLMTNVESKGSSASDYPLKW